MSDIMKHYAIYKKGTDKAHPNDFICVEWIIDGPEPRQSGNVLVAEDIDVLRRALQTIAPGFVKLMPMAEDDDSIIETWI